MTKARWGVLGRRGWWLVLTLSGCGAAQKPANEVEATARPASGVATPASTATPASVTAAEDGVAQHNGTPRSAAGAPDAVAASEQRGTNLVLPTASGFTATPIPAGETARYESWRQLGQTRIGKGYLYFLDVLDERRLVVKSADEPDVRIVELATRREVSRWPIVNLDEHESHVVLAWRSREPSVLVGKGDGLWQYAAESGRLVTQLATHPVDRARWSEDGRVLVTAQLSIPAQTARLRFYEASEKGLTLVGELPETERVDAWALSRDNRYLARVFYPSDRVTIVDLHTGQILLDAPAQRYVGSVEFSPNGRWLVLGGEGVKWFDVSDPERRTEYTHFYNNVGDVEFSPSGDVLAVASFDGQVRLLTYDEQSNRIELLRSFAHQKNTNVYTLRFLEAGNTLASSSGDRTVRFWGAGVGATKAPAMEQWRSPSQWAEQGKQWGKPQWGEKPRGREERGARAVGAPTPPHPLEGAAEQHYVPARLRGTPAPSRIEPGTYECKISTLYKLRRCTVEKDAAGHTLLEFDKENLLGLRGVLYDDGVVVRFEGWLTAGGSLGCANCAAQPIHAVFRGQGGSWQGLLLYRGHYDPKVPVEVPPDNVVIEEAIDRFPLVLRRK